MGGLGAFLNAFGATTMEYQKRAQDQQKVAMEMQIQQAQLAMQQMQFERTMQNRELVRQDALKQHQVENEIAAEKAAREEKNTASLIESRKGATERDERRLSAYTAGVKGQNVPQKGHLRYQADRARKQGNIALAEKLEGELSAIESDESRATGGEQPAAQPQPQGGGMLQGDVPPPSLEDEAGAGEPSEPMMGGVGVSPQGGGDQAGQATPQAQTQAQPQPQGGAQQPQAQPAMPRGQVKVQPLSSGLEEELYETEPEAEAKRQEYKTHGIHGVVVTSKTGKAKEGAELSKAKQDDIIYSGALISSDQGKAEVQDILNRNNLQDVEFQASPKGLERSGYNINVGAGGLLKSSLRGSVSRSGGESHMELPKAAFVPRSRPTWVAKVPVLRDYVAASETMVAPEFAENVATAFANDALQRGQELPPMLADAAKDLVRDQRKVVMQLTENDAGPISLLPFDAFNRPDRAMAAKLARSGKRAEDQLAGVTKDYTRVNMPSVVDRNNIPLNQKLGLFTSAVTGDARAYKEYGGLPLQGAVDVAEPLNAEQQGLAMQELAQHVQPDLKDGSFSPGAKKEAMRAWEAVQGSPTATPDFKRGVYQILKPVLLTPTTDEGEKQAKKEQAKSDEPKAEGGMGSIGMRGAVTLSALGTMGEKGRAAPKTPAVPPKKASTDQTSVQNEFASVKSAQNRAQAASKAASNITSQWGRLSETEKSNVRKQWASQRGLWKSYGVPEETLKKLDALVGKDKSREDVISDAAREIEKLKKKG